MKLYRFSVCAVNEVGESAASDVATFSTSAGPPEQPAPVRMVSRTSTTLNVAWAAPEVNNGAEVSEYALEMDTVEFGFKRVYA